MMAMQKLVAEISLRKKEIEVHAVDLEGKVHLGEVPIIDLGPLQGVQGIEKIDIEIEIEANQDPVIEANHHHTKAVQEVEIIPQK